MRVLVTGANGFIGKRLCRRLKEQHAYVRAFLRTPAGGDWDDVCTGDLENGILPAGCMKDIDTVFHLAAKVHALSENRQDDAGYHRLNVEGTRVLLQEAAKEKTGSFIYFSSVKAAGEAGETVIDELYAGAPDTPYGVSKLAAEQAVLAETRISHRAVLRPSMVYGPGNAGNLGKMIKWIDRGIFPPLPDITNYRSMVHVEDVVSAALRISEDPRANGQVYILSDGRYYSTRQIYEWICGVLARPVPKWHVPYSALKLLGKFGDLAGKLGGRRFVFDSDALDKLLGSACYNSDKIRRELDFTPRHDLYSSLPEIVTSFKPR